MFTSNVARPLRWVVVLGMLISVLAVQSIYAQPADKTEVFPGAVRIQPGTCVGGELAPATVSVPADTTGDGIFYTITQPNAEGNFEVHAQVGDAFTMGDTSGTGWERANEWNAYFTGTAPVPDCNGPTPTPDTSQNEASENEGTVPDVGETPLPQDCGSVPYPAPTGSDVTSSILFSNFIITQNGEAHSGGAISLTAPTEELTLSFDWVSTGSVSAGQYFTFVGPLDVNGNKVFTSATQWFPVLNTAGSAQAGCASVVGGDITVQFTDYVNPLNSVDGRISIDLVMAAASLEEASTIEFTFDDVSTFAIQIPGTPSGEFGKRGWFMRPDEGLVENLGSVRWQLIVPASPVGYTNLVLVDSTSADSGWTFSCAGENPTSTVMVATGLNGPVDLLFTEECGALAMTLTVASVPANTSIDFYFYADITPAAQGPFYNVATAQADQFEVLQLPYEVQRTLGSGILDGEYAVSPIPPAINHAVCIEGEWYAASASVPTDQEGVVYSMNPESIPATGGYLIVTAELQPGYTWAAGAEANGWVLDAKTNAMVYEADVLNNPCEEVIETPTPPTEEPCIPPPAEECVPPAGSEGETPEPCETPTIPAWCLETPTPPTVTDLPETGTQGGNGFTNSPLIAGAALAVFSVAAVVPTKRKRG